MGEMVSRAASGDALLVRSRQGVSAMAQTLATSGRVICCLDAPPFNDIAFRVLMECVQDETLCGRSEAVGR